MALEPARQHQLLPVLQHPGPEQQSKIGSGVGRASGQQHRQRLSVQGDPDRQDRDGGGPRGGQGRAQTAPRQELPESHAQQPPHPDQHQTLRRRHAENRYGDRPLQPEGKQRPADQHEHHSEADRVGEQQIAGRGMDSEDPIRLQDRQRHGSEPENEHRDAGEILRREQKRDELAGDHQKQDHQREEEESQLARGVVPDLEGRPVLPFPKPSGHSYHHDVGSRGRDEVDHRQLEAADGVNGEGGGIEIVGDDIVMEVRLERLQDDDQLERQGVGQLALQQGAVGPHVSRELPPQIEQQRDRSSGRHHRRAQQQACEAVQEKSGEQDEHRPEDVGEGIADGRPAVSPLRDQ